MVGRKAVGANRIDARTEDAVVRDGGPRDPDLEGDVIQREEAEKRGTEVLARVRSEDEDLVGRVEVRNVVLTDVVSKSFETAVVTSIDPKNATESGSSTRSAEPR